MPQQPELLLLHGALGSGDQLQPLASVLTADFSVHTLTFSGHGGLPIVHPLSLPQLAQDVLRYLDEHQLPARQVFGYSMGGYVATYIALHFPDRFDQIHTLGTKWAWTPQSADKETRLLDPDVIEEKVPQFAKQLKARHHPEDWRKVLEFTAEFMHNLSQGTALQQSDFERIETPIHILRGDQDNMVTEAESQQVADWLPHGSYQSLSDTPHPIEQVDYGMLLEVMHKSSINRRND